MQRGFTLLEFMVVIGITAVVVTAIAVVSIGGFQSQFFLRRQNEAIESVKRALESMEPDIREAADGDDGAYPIEEAEPYSFIFYSDIDVDSKTERVRFFIENGELKKGLIE